MPMLTPPSARAPVDLSVLGDFVAREPRGSNTRPEYFYGQNTNGVESNTEGEGVPVLKWTASAPLRVITLAAAGMTVYGLDNDPDLFHIEVSRTTHTERINNEGGEGFVDVEVIDTIDMQNLKNTPRKLDFTGDGGV